MPSPSYDLERIRQTIPLLRHAVPMNNCSQAPLSHATQHAAEEFLASWNERGMDWDRWMEEVDLARATFARLINADPGEIAAVTSLSHAATVIASAIDFGGARRAVVTSEAEFPTVGHVWLAQEKRGAALRWVGLHDGALETDDFARLIDGETAIVSVTDAYYLNGSRQDIAALTRRAHEHGARVFVDAYQSIGTAPFDVKAAGVDFLAAGTLKFLMGTPGIAFLYVRRECIAELHPTVTGWFGRANPFAFDATHLDWSDRATRFEAGTPSIFSAYVSRAGMALLLDVGLEAIGEWNTTLSEYLIAGGRARGLSLHGPGASRPKTPTTAFLCPGDSHEVERCLRDRGIVASARGPVIRLAPHFYSSLEDCDRALDALAAELRRA